ncbi:unnamed protein product, partial [Echinostoma caproni]|uniref:ADF-H domain-containing protein n=1 Tax=Echinostoma caproni TaxID=27848 RepID=A0A183BH43_9TREM
MKSSTDDHASLPKGVSLAEQLRRLISQLMTLLSSVIAGGFVHTHSAPTIPAPDKFFLKDDFSLWVADAKNYVDLFLPAEQRRFLLSLLDTDARAILLQDGILDEEVTDDTFTQLQSALTTHKNPMLLQFQFQTRAQQPDEAFDVYVFLRCHEISGKRKFFIRYTSQTVQQAIDTAREEEQLEDVIRQYQVSAPSYAMATGPSRTPQGYSRPPQPNPDQHTPTSEVVAEFLVGQQSAATV